MVGNCQQTQVYNKKEKNAKFTLSFGSMSSAMSYIDLLQ